MILYGGHIGDVFWGWCFISGKIYTLGIIIPDWLEGVSADCLLDIYGDRILTYGIERWYQEQTARTC